MRVQSEKGFALPMTVFLVTILTVMLASAFARTGTEIMIAASSEAGVDARAIAQSGLQAYFGQDFTERPASGDSIRYNIAGGYAWVVPSVLRAPADTLDDFTFIVRSTGYKIEAAQGSDPLAERTIAQFALWETGSITELAAITAANGIRRRDEGDIKIWGDDGVCSTSESVPHTRRPTEWATYYLEDSNGGLSQSGTGAQVAAATNIHWAAIDGGWFEADYNYLKIDDESYPSMLITGDLTMSDAKPGYGLLIVTGDLTTTGEQNEWRGVVLVGGRMLFHAKQDKFWGAIITGLDEQLGSSPGQTEVGGEYQAGDDLPHPEVEDYVRRKGDDIDRWLHGMQRLRRRSTES